MRHFKEQSTALVQQENRGHWLAILSPDDGTLYDPVTRAGWDKKILFVTLSDMLENQDLFPLAYFFNHSMKNRIIPICFCKTSCLDTEEIKAKKNSTVTCIHNKCECR